MNMVSLSRYFPWFARSHRPFLLTVRIAIKSFVACNLDENVSGLLEQARAERV